MLRPRVSAGIWPESARMNGADEHERTRRKRGLQHLSVQILMATTIDQGVEMSRFDAAGRRTKNLRRVRAWLGIAVVSLAILLGLVTFSILTGLTPISPDPPVVIALMIINAGTVTALIGLITWHVVDISIARRRKVAGARLHVRLVSMFSIVAAIPAILVAVFASVTLDRGLDAWFSERTRTIVDNALSVARSYVQEHGQVIRIDADNMINVLNQRIDLYMTDRRRFRRILTIQTGVRRLAAAYIIDQNSVVRMEVSLSQEPPLAPVAKEILEQAAAGEVVVIPPGDTNRVTAVGKLDGFDEEFFLVVYRYVDPRVLESIGTAFVGKSEYDRMEDRRGSVQFTFALMYVGVSLIFLLAAVWFAIRVADRLIQPISRLVTAAQKVSEGVLDVEVPVGRGEGDLATLGLTFNRMTTQLRTQRDELVSANVQLDERRRFTEAVLSGVSAGVIGLGKNKRINLANRSALRLLDIEEDRLLNKQFTRVIPEFAPIFARALKKARGDAEGQVTLRRDGAERILTVRVTTEHDGRRIHGYVVTFDEITELVTAQRSSAWADIARRIAHEIKNPLTPIQLSAERLRRKYGRVIREDREIFEQCTQTIIRQVGDIGRMVDEFSSFARMPKAVLEPHDLGEVVRESVFLQQVSQSAISLDMKRPKKPIIVAVDRRLIAQAVTNLVKNATESIETRQRSEAGLKGKITVRVDRQKDSALIEVIDNGIGLPVEDRRRLVEPYITTREKGTGLGLAIVMKITEEHGGRLVLDDAPGLAKGETGARVRIEIPLTSAVPPAAGASASRSRRAREKKTKVNA